MLKNLASVAKSNYKQNKAGYICIGIIILAIILFNGVWTWNLSTDDTGIDKVMSRYGHTPFDETFWDFNDAMQRLSCYKFFVAESTCVAIVFAVITLVVVGSVFVLSLRNGQSPLKRSEQVRYTGLTLLAYSGLLYLTAYWLGQISILIRNGGAATLNVVCSQNNLPIQELGFIIVDIGLILLTYALWKILALLFKESKLAGWILTIFTIVIVLHFLFILFFSGAFLMLISHYL